MLCSTLFLQLWWETISQSKGPLHSENVPSQVAPSLIQSIITASHPSFSKLFRFWRAHIEVVISVLLTRLRCMLRRQWMPWMMIISFTWWYKKNYISFGSVRGSDASEPEPDLHSHLDKVWFEVWKNGWTEPKSGLGFSQMPLRTGLNQTWASLFLTQLSTFLTFRNWTWILAISQYLRHRHRFATGRKNLQMLWFLSIRLTKQGEASTIL